MLYRKITRSIIEGLFKNHGYFIVFVENKKLYIVVKYYLYHKVYVPFFSFLQSNRAPVSQYIAKNNESMWSVDVKKPTSINDEEFPLYLLDIFPNGNFTRDMDNKFWCFDTGIEFDKLTYMIGPVYKPGDKVAFSTFKNNKTVYGEVIDSDMVKTNHVGEINERLVETTLIDKCIKKQELLEKGYVFVEIEGNKGLAAVSPIFMRLNVKKINTTVKKHTSISYRYLSASTYESLQ